MKMKSTDNVGQSNFPLVILGMLGAGILLCGCAFWEGIGTPQESSPSDRSEPPAMVGNTATPLPQNGTITAPTTTPGATLAVDGDDQPISNPASTPADKSLGTAEPPDLNRPHITGRVTSSDGQPVMEAILMITRGTAEFPERTFLTDENGRYIITVPQGTFTVLANGEGFKSAEKEVAVGPGETILDFELERE